MCGLPESSKSQTIGPLTEATTCPGLLQSQEPGTGQGWLKITQWPAGSQTGPEPGPQAPPSIQNQSCWSGEEGKLVSNLGLHWAQSDCSLLLHSFSICRVPGCSLPQVLLMRKIWCQHPQICVPSGRRQQVRLNPSGWI